MAMIDEVLNLFPAHIHPLTLASDSDRLRQVRTEAVRACFADCFKRQDYNTIVKIAERLPEDVLREDPDLLMYYDSALLRKK